MATSNKNFRVKNGLDVNGEINVSAVGGDEGGQINLAKPATGTTLSGNVAIDIYQDKIRIFDQGGTNRGAYIDLSAAGTGVSSNLLAGGTGGSSNSFETISANGTSVVADSSTDTLTITPGDGLSITGNATSDTITFTPNVASASANGIVTTGTQTFAGEKTFSNTITANANIIANTGFVSADTFIIDTTFTGGSTQPGEIAWDVDEGTVMFKLADGEVTHRIGQQMDIRVVNNTGSTITEGAVVYINGSSGQEPTIALANAATEGASSKTIGVVTHQGGIANAASGYICISGIMRGVDVGSYAAGTPLWLSNVAGVFTDTKPTPPDNGVFVGWVVKAGTGGSILIAIQNGYEVNELHDVLYTSLAQDDILQRNSANTLWVNKTLAGANIANLASATVTFAGNVVATTNVNATTFNGSGAGLTSIPAANLSGTVAVANGGTGASNATAARTNLETPKVYTQTTEPAGGSVGDIWIDTDSSVTPQGVGYVPAGGPIVYTTPTNTSNYTATYTPTAGTRAIRITLVGGGAGGGGANASFPSAGGGGAGAYAMTWTTSIAASYDITVGAGGAGGSAGVNGSNGNATSVYAGATNIASAGGGFAGASSGGDGGAGGDAGTGTIISGGGGGQSGGGNNTAGQSGSGGASFFGGGGHSGGTPGNWAGVAAKAYGAGGSGGRYSNANQTGGAGKAGIIIIEEFV